MRCRTCHEDVDEDRAMPMAPAVGELLQNTSWHLRYVEGVLPPGPETSPLHAGPVVCGPLEGGPHA